MSAPEWKGRIATLASEIGTACEAALAPATIRCKDLTGTMWAEEEDPNVVPRWPIGSIYHYRFSEKRAYHLFGIRRLAIPYWGTLLEFGMEEMWNAPLWARAQGLWGFIRIPRLVPALRPLFERFSRAHEIRLKFSGT